MAEDIRPALSAAEWIQYGDDLAIMADWAADKRPYGPDRRFSMDEKRHAVAAMALHKQVFGFTQEEASLVEAQARFYEHRAFAGDTEAAAKLRLLARKISALLPPRAAEEVLEKLPE